MRLLLPVALFAAVLTSSPLAAAGRDGGPRIRPQDSRIAEALREGIARSATFKSLVDRIEASNVIVYAALNPLMKSNLSGALTWMTRAGDFRYVRASISVELTFDQMIATLGHELQHAVEVIEDEAVTDEKSLVALYRRIGHQSDGASPLRWETAAAQQAGFQVRRELVGLPAATISARSRAFSQS